MTASFADEQLDQSKPVGRLSCPTKLGAILRAHPYSFAAVASLGGFAAATYPSVVFMILMGLCLAATSWAAFNYLKRRISRQREMVVRPTEVPQGEVETLKGEVRKLREKLKWAWVGPVFLLIWYRHNEAKHRHVPTPVRQPAQESITQRATSAATVAYWDATIGVLYNPASEVNPKEGETLAAYLARSEIEFGRTLEHVESLDVAFVDNDLALLVKRHVAGSRRLLEVLLSLPALDAEKQLATECLRKYNAHVEAGGSLEDLGLPAEFTEKLEKIVEVSSQLERDLQIMHARLTERYKGALFRLPE